ncbi:MAG: outer membrane beta-barrel protein, partial [Myxococcales bacterium]|nr:outer membrane beta-barrel protein [Myxococcales bacterium]
PTPAVQPPPAPAPAPVPAFPVEEPPAEPPAEEAEGPSPLSFGAFVDAHFALQTGQLGGGTPGHRAYAGASPTPGPIGSGLVNDNGFALNFAGLDAVYDGGEAGATLSLRFGPKMGNYHFNSTGSGSLTAFGIENVTQAYGTWSPSEAVSIDLGMFGTIFGAEVLESWQNLNYTRGALYFAAQPFWHTGLRVAYAASDTVSITGMIVNDANTTWSTDAPDANLPVFALQLGLAPVDALSIAVGGMVAPDDDTASTLETFFDLVVSYSANNFTLIFNGDLNIDRADGGMGEDFMIMGGSLALGYQFTPVFGAALRGELITTDDGDDDTDEEPLVTGTATLDFKPIKDSSNLIVRLEGRVESQKGAFTNADGDMEDIWLMGTLGMVVTTD